MTRVSKGLHPNDSVLRTLHPEEIMVLAHHWLYRTSFDPGSGTRLLSESGKTRPPVELHAVYADLIYLKLLEVLSPADDAPVATTYWEYHYELTDRGHVYMERILGLTLPQPRREWFWPEPAR